MPASISFAVLIKKRAFIYSQIRSFFNERDVLEVETPVLSFSGTVDPTIDSFTVKSQFYQQPLFLQTSPEFAMKRLLVEGSGSIYQICRSFRDGESGRRHNPEFSMLEWYRLDFSYFDLMQEVDHLVRQIVPGDMIKKESEYISYNQLFIQYLAIDPLAADIGDLINCAKHHNLNVDETTMGDDFDLWLGLLLSHLIEPKLGVDGLTFVYDYPASQAALARLKPQDSRIAERFELYINGVEVANGFQELQDADEQRERFISEQEVRKESDKMVVPFDNHLLNALSKGLPFCAGVALGLDRLIMLALKANSITDVIPFSFDAV